MNAYKDWLAATAALAAAIAEADREVRTCEATARQLEQYAAAPEVRARFASLIQHWHVQKARLERALRWLEAQQPAEQEPARERT